MNGVRQWQSATGTTALLLCLFAVMQNVGCRERCQHTYLSDTSLLPTSSSLLTAVKASEHAITHAILETQLEREDYRL